MKNKKITLHRALLAIVLILVLGCQLAACALRPKAARDEEGNTLFRMAFADSINSYNPYSASSDSGSMFLALIYDTLFTSDPSTGEIAGSLCTDYTVKDSNDGARVWTLNLRQSLWSDGNEVTASDVEFSLQSQSLFSALYSHPVSDYIDTVGIAVNDDHSISFVAWCGDEYILECLCKIPILPRHIWNSEEYMNFGSNGLPADYSAARQELGQLPSTSDRMVSSGMYLWESGNSEQCILRRNNNYYLDSKADKVCLIWNIENGLEELQQGNVDAVYCGEDDSADGQTGRRSFYTSETPSEELCLIEFNYKDSKDSHLGEAVRQALSLAADTESMLAAMGGGTPAEGLLSADTFLPSDVSQALECLSSAGMTDADGDGVREDADGRPLIFTLLYNEDIEAFAEAASIFAENASEIGIRIIPEGEEAETAADRRDKGDYDLYLTSWRVSKDPQFTMSLFYWNDGLNAFYVKDEQGRSVYPGWNESGYCSEEFDSLYEKLTAVSGSDERGVIASEMNELLIRDHAVIGIGYKTLHQICSAAWRTGRSGETVLFTFDTIRLRLADFTTR